MFRKAVNEDTELYTTQNLLTSTALFDLARQVAGRNTLKADRRNRAHQSLAEHNPPSNQNLWAPFVPPATGCQGYAFVFKGLFRSHRWTRGIGGKPGVWPR